MDYPKFVTDFADMLKWIDQLKKTNAEQANRIRELKLKIEILQNIKVSEEVEKELKESK